MSKKPPLFSKSFWVVFFLKYFEFCFSWCKLHHSIFIPLATILFWKWWVKTLLAEENQQIESSDKHPPACHLYLPNKQSQRPGNSPIRFQIRFYARNCFVKTFSTPETTPWPWGPKRTENIEWNGCRQTPFSFSFISPKWIIVATWD
jgi:hypothetical protein